MSDRIHVTFEDGVADVRLSRADKMNALDEAMFAALVETGEGLKARKGLRAVVLSGEGRAFCAGLDMGNFGRMASGERRGSGASSPSTGPVSGGLGERTHGEANHAQHAVLVWRQIPVPVIAAVHGVAFGGGFQLMLGADMRFIAPDARLAVLEIKWGLVPDMAGTRLMKGLAREDVIKELTFSGRIFSGQEALALGFATRVCADPHAEALALAHEIAGRNPDAIRAAKRLLNAAGADSDAEGLMRESVEQGALIGSPNQVEAIRANLEQRAPAFIDS